jgi:hypothetical protein
VLAGVGDLVAHHFAKAVLGAERVLDGAGYFADDRKVVADMW